MADNSIHSWVNDADNGAPLDGSPPEGIQSSPEQDGAASDAGAATGEGLLTVDFSAPLSGAARTARLRQMAAQHPAFEGSRKIHRLLMNAQAAILCMQGVPGSEANKLASQLREVGHLVTQETAQLVDAVVNLSLDQEDTDKAIARISIAANLAGAKTDDQAQTISQLRGKLTEERAKREEAESRAGKTCWSLEALEGQVKALKAKLGMESEELPLDGSEKDLESPSGGTEPRLDTTELPAAEQQGQGAAAQPSGASLFPQTPIRAAKPQGWDGERPDTALASLGDALSSSAFPSNVGAGGAPPTGFASRQVAPPRGPAAFAHHGQLSGHWGSGSGPQHITGNNQGGLLPTSAYGPALRSASSYQPLQRYHAGGPDYYHQAGFMAPRDGMVNHAAFGQRPHHYPGTPSSAGRSRQGHYPQSGIPAAIPHTQVPYGTMARSIFSGPPPVQVTDRAITAWHERILDFYARIRAFADSHAAMPEQRAVRQVSNTGLWPMILATYRPLSESEALSYLDIHLRSDKSKSCLVTRLVVDFAVQRIWVPGAWASPEKKTGLELLDIQQSFETNAAQTSAIRQPLLDQQAALVSQIVKSEQGSMALQSRASDTARTLLAMLRPLMNSSVDHQEAYRDLVAVAELAWDLSAQMLTSRLTFDFRFPEVSTRFTAQAMVPIWPQMDPAELQAKHYRVALVTTPAVTCRNDTSGSITVHSIALADVVCMQ